MIHDYNNTYSFKEATIPNKTIIKLFQTEHL